MKYIEIVANGGSFILKTKNIDGITCHAPS
jgi:hypothetical protein